MENRKIDVIFVREYKSFIGAFNKKSKSDYLLNVTKIVRDKFNTRFLMPNKVQSFLLNYEVKKLLDKAIKVKNKKYTRIIYLNTNLSISTVLNSIDFINEEYFDLEFSYLELKTSGNKLKKTFMGLSKSPKKYSAKIKLHINSIDFINEEYFDLEFSYFMIPSKEIEEDIDLIGNPKLEILDPARMKLLTEESII